MVSDHVKSINPLHVPKNPVNLYYLCFAIGVWSCLPSAKQLQEVRGDTHISKALFYDIRRFNRPCNAMIPFNHYARFTPDYFNVCPASCCVISCVTNCVISCVINCATCYFFFGRGYMVIDSNVLPL